MKSLLTALVATAFTLAACTDAPTVAIPHSRPGVAVDGEGEALARVASEAVEGLAVLAGGEGEPDKRDGVLGVLRGREVGPVRGVDADEHGADEGGR